MKVILQTDVRGLGKRGDVVNASDGHARNYLFPRNLAIPADKQNLNELSAKNAAKAHKRELEKADAIKTKEKLDKEILKIGVKAGENGKIFGSITSKEISENLENQYKEKIDKKKIVLKEPIKTIGIHTVDLRLFEGVICKLRVNVVSK